MFIDQACWTPNIRSPFRVHEISPSAPQTTSGSFSFNFVPRVGVGEGMWHTCMFVWLYRQMHAGVHAMHTHGHRRPEHIVRVPPSRFSTLFFETGSPLNLELTGWLG